MAKREIYLNRDRYVAALKRIKEQITELTYYDNDDIGNKSIGCSWGLCSESKEQWPDEEDYLFDIIDDKVSVNKHSK